MYIIVHFNVRSKHCLIYAPRHYCIRTCQYYGKCNWRLPSWIEALSINNEYCIREYVNLKIFFVVLFTSADIWCDLINMKAITCVMTLMLTQIRGSSSHKNTYKVFPSVSKWVSWIPAIIFIIKILPHKIFTAQHFISHYNLHSWSGGKCHKKAAICLRLL